MAETLSMISLISFLAAGAFAILAVILWFVFRIPTVAGELSGRIAKKSIERMRKSNEEAGKSRIGGENVKSDPLFESGGGVYYSEETIELTDENDEGAARITQAERRGPAAKIDLLEEILLIHTKEVIE